MTDPSVTMGNAVMTGFYAKEYEMLDDFAGKNDPTLPPGHSNFGAYDPNGSVAARAYSEIEQFKLDYADAFSRVKANAGMGDASDNQVMAIVKRSHELAANKTPTKKDTKSKTLLGIGERGIII